MMIRVLFILLIGSTKVFSQDDGFTSNLLPANLHSKGFIAKKKSEDVYLVLGNTLGAFDLAVYTRYKKVIFKKKLKELRLLLKVGADFTSPDLPFLINYLNSNFPPGNTIRPWYDKVVILVSVPFDYSSISGVGKTSFNLNGSTISFTFNRKEAFLLRRYLNNITSGGFLDGYVFFEEVNSKMSFSQNFRYPYDEIRIQLKKVVFK